MFANKYIINIAVIIKAVLIAYPSIAAEGSGMPQMVIPDFMPQLVWLIVIFSLLYFSMKYLALPRITEIISNRDLKIVNDLEKAEEIKKQIEQTNKEHQDAVDDTNDKIKIIVNEINKKSLLEADKKLEQCQNDINKKIQEEKIKLEKELEEFNKIFIIDKYSNIQESDKLTKKEIANLIISKSIKLHEEINAEDYNRKNITI